MLSTVIITLNEALNIERAILSVRGISDDIVVVDSGSTDDTAGICRRLGARVIVRPWEGYSATKNYANTQAANPWILSLDADEALSTELKESIQKHVKGELPMNRVFSFNRLTSYCGKWIHHSGWYPDRKIRIWHRDFGQWEGMIHEALAFRGKPEVVHLRGDLLHYSFHTREEYLKQMDNFTTLAAESLFKSGKRAGYPKIILAPVIRFLRDYLIRGGYRDGRAGLEVSCGSAHTVSMKYRKLRKLWVSTGRR
ncbi:MAG: glycosyltransferase family 2 protein [Bacteroidales bacterium]